jgi:S1-C subfamily serine protease
MRRRYFKIFGWIGLVTIILMVGATAGGGVVYALSQNQAGDSAAEGGAEEPGIVIASVVADGPAAQAGVKRGDILLRIDEQATDSFRELTDYLSTLSAGSQATLTLLHGDETRTFTVTLGERNGRSYLGVIPCGVAPPPSHPIEQNLTGVTIITVTPNSPAAQIGLQRGDMILAIDGQNVDPEHPLPDLVAAHQPGDSVILTVKSPGQAARQVSVTLNEHPQEPGAAHLGVQFRPGPARGGTVVGGLFIEAVAEGSPAAAAGLSRGEVITAIDGEPVNRPPQFLQALAERQPGDAILLTVTEAAASEGNWEVAVTLGEHPAQSGQAYLGIHFRTFPFRHFGDFCHQCW